MNKGFNTGDGKYMCSCACGRIFFSDNKRDIVCPECAKQSTTFYKIQKYNGKWVDVPGYEYADDQLALKNCKSLRQNDVNYIYRVIKVSTEVLPLP